MKITLFALALTALAMTMGGCEKSKSQEMDEVRAWMRDDLATTYETNEEVRNRMTHTMYINGRKINGDLVRFFLLDHPSRDISSPTIGEFE